MTLAELLKLAVSGPNSNFPVSSNDVSTYAPIQGSTYPMAGITSLRPNPQTRSTFWDTDATGVRRNLNIGQEQSPMKTPDMPQLPKEGAFKLGYARGLEKLGLSDELINRVAVTDYYTKLFKSFVDAAVGEGSLISKKELQDRLRSKPRILKRLWPQVREGLLGPKPPPQIAHALYGAKDVWKLPGKELLPPALRKFAERMKNITPATGSMTSPGKQPGGAIPVEEKPVTRGDRAEAIWR